MKGSAWPWAAKPSEERAVTATPIGRFAYQITNAFAELERALIAERTRAGMEAARRRGARIGRPPKLSMAEIDDARDALAAGEVTITTLAGRLGVTPRTLTRALDRAAPADSCSAAE